MTALLERSPLTAALGPWLEVAVGRPVGVRQAPPNRPHPFVTLYSVPGGSFWGPGLTAPEENAWVVYQANCVALSGDAADALLDAVRAAFLLRADGAFVTPGPDVPGWTVIDRRADGGPGDVEYAGAPPKRVFTASERFVLCLTPATQQEEG